MDKDDPYDILEIERKTTGKNVKSEHCPVTCYICRRTESEVTELIRRWKNNSSEVEKPEIDMLPSIKDIEDVGIKYRHFVQISLQLVKKQRYSFDLERYGGVTRTSGKKILKYNTITVCGICESIMKFYAE